jgi:glyoxylase-like metal-dependent hydrolase (beta-lactamase superfamily II)/ACT domain-containing protein
MSESKTTRTFATRMPDKPGAFMLACKVIMEHDGNIVRVSFNKGINLFIDVCATPAQLNAIDKELSSISYVDEVPPEPTILVMNVRIKDTPGALYPVLKVIDKYDVNISYLNSSAENKDYQNFSIGMEVDNPGISKKILDEVAGIYALDVPDYNGKDPDLDNTVFYIRLANNVQKLFSFGDDRVMQFISESAKVTKILKKRGEDPHKVFEGVKQLANFIAFHRDLNFKPKISQIEITDQTTLHVIEPPAGSNIYILRNDDSLLFIDTGLGIYADEMFVELREMFPAFFSMDKTIIVTHADVDHCGLLSIIDDAKVVINKKTVEGLNGVMENIIDNGTNAFSLCYARLSTILTDYNAPDQKNFRVIGKGVPAVHGELLKLETVKFGDLELELYEGNGAHLPGEMVIICRAPKLLFTGDIYVNEKGLTPERADFNDVAPFLLTNVDAEPDNMKADRANIGKLMDSIGRKGMLVCAGHGAVKKL